MLTDVADVAGNKLPTTHPISVLDADARDDRRARRRSPRSTPASPCALTGGDRDEPGPLRRAARGSDDLYQPFTLAANEPIEVAFTQPPAPTSVVPGTACNTGSVRIEEVDGAGTCIAAVAGHAA